MPIQKTSKSRPRRTQRVALVHALAQSQNTARVQVTNTHTLAIDIGGTGIKMLVLDPAGAPINERARELTPKPATPKKVLAVIERMVAEQPRFERVSVGFPGIVVHGVTLEAPNLGKSWIGFPLQQELHDRLAVPVRVINDADLQGYGAIEGRGVELVITLGTGMGSALYLDGKLVPNLELGHHPLAGTESYEDLLRDSEMRKIGKKRWSRRVSLALKQMRLLFNPDRTYVGGGNAGHFRLDLPENTQVFSNVEGMRGGIRLWANDQAP